MDEDSTTTATSSSFDAAGYARKAAPLFAALHASNRRALSVTSECRESTSKARKEMDERFLALQNLLFEKQHLEDEIRKCEGYESQYQNVPLLPLDQLHHLAASNEPPKSLTVPLPTDEHELMLARLQFELAERQRYDEEKKVLGSEKARLIKDNEVKKNNLEELEKKLDGFVEQAKAIQAKMHEGDPQQQQQQQQQQQIEQIVIE